jgi:simple sugar transport system ATP-binding protein
MTDKQKIPLIELRNVCKSFGRLEAIKNLNLKIYKGESLGLVGDNGAGKSTLIKMLSGLFPQDKGQIFINGQEVRLNSYADSTKYGIETIYQDSAVVDLMNIYRNIFLGRELTKAFGIMDVKEMERLSMEVLDSIGIQGINNTSRLVGELSGGQKQSVAIARAVYFKSKCLFLDEPTSALSVKETRFVHDFIIRLKKEGISTIYVSHTIANVHDVVDRFVILRQGEAVGEYMQDEISVVELSDIICNH